MSDSNPENRTKIDRRRALLLPAAGLGAAALATTAEAADITKGGSQDPEQLLDAPQRCSQDPVRQGPWLCPGRCPHLQRHPLRPEYGRRKPLASRQTSQALERRISRARLRRQLPAAPARLHRDRTIVPLRLDRRLHERRHAQAQRLDAVADRQTSRAGLLSRRRLHLRLRL